MKSGEKTDKEKTLLEDINLLEQYVHELSTFFPLPLCFVSPAGIILEVNPMFEKVFGYKFHELIGEKLDRVADKKVVEDLRTSTLENESVRGREVVFRTSGGEEIPTSIYTQVRKDAEGRVLGFFLSLLDLRDIKRAGDQMRSAAEELKMERDQLAKLQEAVEVLSIVGRKSLQEVLPGLSETIGAAVGSHAVAIWTVRKDKNGSAFDILVAQGLTDTYVKYIHSVPLKVNKDTVVGTAAVTRSPTFSSNFKELPERGDMTKELKDFIVREGVLSLASFPLIVRGELFGVLNFYFSQEHNFPSSERRILQLSANMVAIAIGNIESRKDLEDAQKAVLNMLEDTDDALRRVETERNKTRLVIANFTDGLIVFDEGDRISLINLQAQEIFGISQERLLGKKMAEVEGNGVLRELAKVFRQEEKIFRREIATENGPVLEATRVDFGAERGGQKSMVVLHDITREKEVERLKTEFVSLAAHQLRTPLSAVKWTLRMLLDGDLGDLTEEQKNFIGKTYRSNERMIGLINDLLDVTRIEEGKYLSRPKMGSIEDILSGLVKLYREDAERKGVSVKLDLPSRGLPRVMIDEEKMRLVFQNLLENAFHYTPKGGKIIVDARKNGEEKELRIAVRDTGIGIPAHQQARIFQKFFRADNAKRVDTEGSGLGLYVAKNIIEAHEGKIWFESEPGKGTVFYVSLPTTREGEEFLKGL